VARIDRRRFGLVKVTPEKKIAFCAALAASGGSVTRACEAIDVARMTAYRWREEDSEFSKAWDDAKAAGLDALEDEALRRAYEGYDKPIVHQGVITDTVREYSDTLAIFLLKGGKPQKYRDNVRQEISGPDGGPVKAQIVIATGVPDDADWV
jgi:transposase-like protein